MSTTDISAMAAERADYGQTFQTIAAILTLSDKGLDQPMFFQILLSREVSQSMHSSLSKIR